MATLGAPATPKSLFDEGWRRYTPLRRRVEGSLSLTPQQAGTLQTIVQMWRKSASANYPPAMYQYGLALERGVAHTSGGRAKDLAESFKYMKSAAARNHLEAMLHLADLYLKGEVPSRNNNNNNNDNTPPSNASHNNSSASAAAAPLRNRSSESTGAGTSRLDRADSSGSNRSHSSSSSRSRANRGSRSLSRDRSSGNTRTLLNRSAPSSSAADVSASVQAEGMRWLRKAAHAGSTDAALQLGRSFMVGQPPVVPKPNQRKAFEYFEMAASKGHAIAQCNLGEYLWQGVPAHANNQPFVSISGGGVSANGSNSNSSNVGGSGNIGNGTSSAYSGSNDGIARTTYGAPKAVFQSVHPYPPNNGRVDGKQQEPPSSPTSPCTTSPSDTSSSYSLSPPHSPSSSPSSSSASTSLKLHRNPSHSILLSPKTAPVATRMKVSQAPPTATPHITTPRPTIPMAVPCDREAASKWFHLAAAQGDAQACCGVGRCCEALAASSGRGNGHALLETSTSSLSFSLPSSKTERHYKEAFKWYLMAAERGKVAEAQCRLGYLLAEGYGVKRDLPAAAGWYHASAQQGYAEAQYSLGTLIDDFAAENDHSTTSVGTPCVDHNHYSSNNNSSDSRRNRSNNSRSRGSIDHNNNSSNNSSSAGSNAHRAVGARLLRSRDSTGEASKWWQLAAQQQHRGAQLALGFLALEDSSSSGSPTGSRLMTSGNYPTTSGIPTGGMAGGNSYGGSSSGSSSSDPRHHGGMKKHAADAARWFQLAAEQGDADAQYHLACLYAEGHGCGRSLRASGQWMRAAAAQGHKEALLGLGELYEGRYHIDGTLGCFGSLPDENQAKHWYQRAAANAKPDFWDKAKATRHASSTKAARKSITTTKHPSHTNSHNNSNSNRSSIDDTADGSASDDSSCDSESESDDGSPWNGIGCPGQVAAQRLRRLRNRARRQCDPVHEAEVGVALTRSPSGPLVGTSLRSDTTRLELASGTRGRFRPRCHSDDCGHSSGSEEDSDDLGSSHGRITRRKAGSLSREMHDWEVPSPRPAALPPPPPLPPPSPPSPPSPQSTAAYPPSPVLMARSPSLQNQRGSDSCSRGSRKSIVRKIATPLCSSQSPNQGRRASTASSTATSGTANSSTTGAAALRALSSRAPLTPHSNCHWTTTRSLDRQSGTPEDKKY